MVNKRKNDLILLVVLLAAAGLFWLVLTLLSRPGRFVTVTVAGQEVARYALDADGTYTIETPQGQNILVLSEGSAFVQAADCPDQVCVHTQPISRDGQTIVCLPHQLVIEVHGGEEAELDAVTR
jgi:hypothetical protein